MRHITLPRLVFALMIFAVAATSSAVTFGAICYAKPWQDDVATAAADFTIAPEVALRWDTPVTHEWRDQDGALIGTYEATLYDYANDSREIGTLKNFDRELATVVHFFASDPAMRGHLIRHGVTDEQLNGMVAHFEPDEELEAFLAYHTE